MKHPVLPLLLAASLMAACHSARVVPSASSRLVACDTLREVRTDTVVSEVTSPPAPYRVPWYDRVARTIAAAFFIALALMLAFPADSRKS